MKDDPPSAKPRLIARAALRRATTLPISDSFQLFQFIALAGPGPREEIMRNRLALSLLAGCVALLSAAVAAQAPAPGVPAIPPSTPEAPRDADGNLMTGKPFVACGPTTGSQIGILPNSVRNTTAQNAAAGANAGRGAAAGAGAATGRAGPEALRLQTPQPAVVERRPPRVPPPPIPRSSRRCALRSIRAAAMAACRTPATGPTIPASPRSSTVRCEAGKAICASGGRSATRTAIR